MKEQGIVLIGHPGCGKSYFAERCASFWGGSWVDTDRLVEEEYFRKTGKKCSHREIFQQEGESAFREWEEQAIRRISPSISVIATGGGTVLHASSVALLKKRGRMVFLALSPDAWKERISLIGLPVSLSASSPLEGIYEERRRIYDRVADETLFLEGQSEQMVLQVLTRGRL